MGRVIFGHIAQNDAEVVIFFCILLAKYFINFISCSNPSMIINFHSFLKFLKITGIYINLSKDKLNNIRQKCGSLFRICLLNRQSVKLKKIYTYFYILLLYYNM